MLKRKIMQEKEYEMSRRKKAFFRLRPGKALFEEITFFFLFFWGGRVIF